MMEYGTQNGAKPSPLCHPERNDQSTTSKKERGKGSSHKEVYSHFVGTGVPDGPSQ